MPRTISSYYSQNYTGPPNIFFTCYLGLQKNLSSGSKLKAYYFPLSSVISLYIYSNAFINVIVSNFRLVNTRVTRRRMSYKWIEICRNSLVTICNFDLENVGLGHWVQLSQLCHSMANIKIYQGHIFFVLSLTVSEILIFEIFTLKK